MIIVPTMTDARQTIRPVVLCVLDGWGHRDETEDNAIAQAPTPNWDRLMAEAPRAMLETSGSAVGLPKDQMGNSEVGHMNLGAGRPVLQDLPRIDTALNEGALDNNATLDHLVTRLQETGGKCHLMGLLSPGGVHSHQRHLAAVARALDQRGVPTWLHAFTDGRDTPPQAAQDYVAAFNRDTADLENLAFASVSGRYYAMDRDKRWDRTELAYNVLMDADGPAALDANTALTYAYAAGAGDEFITPTVVDGYAGMADGDALLIVNFRADRVRQILNALLDPDFDGFTRHRTVDFCAAVGMVEYSRHLNAFLDTLFPPESMADLMGEVVSRNDRTQLRIAETEKYAHVTFFFNGGEEHVYPGEERILVPSPQVATYDLQPEMSAGEVTDRLVDAIDNDRFDFVVVNYANGDMVGHTGDLQAAIQAVAAVDECLGRVIDSVTGRGGVMLVTADHGNAEKMRDPETGQPFTSHTAGPVDAAIVNAPGWVRNFEDGALCDVAPTLLRLMGLEPPAAMTGRPLLTDGGP